MKSRRAFGLLAAWTAALAAGQGQAADLVLTRPGQIVLSSVSGEATLRENGQRRAAKAEDRVRVDTAVTSGRRSLVTLSFSNGAVLELGPEAEIEIEELLQAPFTTAAKGDALKEEPSVSLTRVRLVRGNLRLAVKPLKVAKGSSFSVAMPAGVARVEEGAFSALVRMTDSGLGMCALELERGVGEFELTGAQPAKLPLGQRLAFAVEVDRRTGAVKVGEMPKIQSR